MNYTRMSGDYVELKCMSEFVKFGYSCLVPYGCWATYDFVVDFNNTFLKIQCKEAQLYYNNDNILISFIVKCKGYNKDDIDYFATVFNDKVYLFPNDFAGGKIAININDSTSDRYHEKFLFENVIVKNKEFLESKERFTKSMKQKTKHYCMDCGKEIYKGSTRCVDCEHKQRRSSKKPNRQELKQLIRSKSFSEIARLYDVSDKCISKWCKAENLPDKKSQIKQISDIDWELI